MKTSNPGLAYLVAVVASGMAVTDSAHAAPFTPGNLVVVQVDGTIDPQWRAYSDTAGPVTLIEFTTALPDPVTGDEAPAVQSITMPTAPSGSNKRFTLPPGATGVGQLTRSVNGLYLVLGGYDADVGTTEVAKTNAAAVNRVIARVDNSGRADTRTGLTDCYHNGTKPIAEFRMVATVDGSAFWMVGKDGADSSDACTRFARYGETTSLRLDSEKKMKEPLGINIFNGQLWVGAFENSSRQGVVQFGVGLPETPTAGPAIQLKAPSPPGGASVRPRDFWFLDDSTLYVADERAKAPDPVPPALPEPWYGGVEKFILDTNPESLTFGKFVYQYTMNAGLPTGINDQAMRSVTGTTDVNGHAVLYAVAAGDDAGANRLMTITDTGCPTGTEEGCAAADTWVTLHTAPSQMVFRGVEWTPRACVGDECSGACCRPMLTGCHETTRDQCDGEWEGLGSICSDLTCPFICPTPFADTDLDHDVDQADFAVLQGCLSDGSVAQLSDECKCFDRPSPGFPAGDGVIDPIDVVAFETCASGPGIPAAEACDDPPPQ
jgi:hypothetical protein